MALMLIQEGPEFARSHLNHILKSSHHFGISYRQPHMSMTFPERLQSSIGKARRPRLFRAFVLAVILTVVLLQFSVMYFRRQRTISGVLDTEVAYLFSNTDPGATTKPNDMVDFCNNLPKRPHPREMYIVKSAKEPLKVFQWRQPVWGNEYDWAKESLTMCPFPLVLQPFFDHFLQKRINRPNIKWSVGYAPCVFWRMSDFDHSVQQCDTADNSKVDYILTTNYTEFEAADILYFDWLFFDRQDDKAPYIDLANMPPRVSHQKWVVAWNGESISNYPFVGLKQYQNLFDLAIGSPGLIMDIPEPVYGYGKEDILRLANIPPAFPFDKVPSSYAGMLVSNCDARNNRKDLMQALIDKAGADSLGGCLNNKALPEGLGRDEGGSWGDWINRKIKALSGYPFVFAGENTNCVDYVTEKVYHALEVGAIPIYMGAENIADYVPEGSYVDVSKFRDFDEVVEYIKTVDRSQFYEWKNVVKEDPSKFCQSCYRPESSRMCRIIQQVHLVEA